MSLEFEYLNSIRNFTNHICNKYDIELIGPGRSAMKMVEQMRLISLELGLTLPVIHLLTHEQSVSLCEGRPSGIPTQLLQTDDRSIVIVDDFILSGTKPKLIHDNMLANCGIYTVFEIMVGAKEKTDPYVNIFEFNPILSTSLNDQYAERDLF